MTGLCRQGAKARRHVKHGRRAAARTCSTLLRRSGRGPPLPGSGGPGSAAAATARSRSFTCSPTTAGRGATSTQRLSYTHAHTNTRARARRRFTRAAHQRHAGGEVGGRVGPHQRHAQRAAAGGGDAERVALPRRAQHRAVHHLQPRQQVAERVLKKGSGGGYGIDAVKLEILPNFTAPCRPPPAGASRRRARAAAPAWPRARRR